MGNRRMISKTVTHTQRFLQLPLETQALYFHLVQDADDDGIVEAFPTMRMINASEDSLKLLIVKEFVIPLNDEMVYFIIHFGEQNIIRADRKVDSKHIELLKKVLPNVEITTTKPRADRKAKDSGRPEDVNGTTTGRLNISKDKLIQDKLIKTYTADTAAVSTAESEKTPSKNEQLKSEFDEIWKLYPKKARKADAERAYIKARKSGTTSEQVKNGIIAYVEHLKTTNTQPQYIAQGGTWFNQQRWLDTYETPNYQKTRQEREKEHFDDWERYMTSSVNTDELPF